MKKKLLVFLMSMMVLALTSCSAGQLTDDDRSILDKENVGSQQQLICSLKPVADNWAGCKPGVQCASPASITGIEMGSLHTGGNDRQLWVYYGGTWQIGVDFGSALTQNDMTIIGSIPNHGLPLRKIFMTNETFWDGPGAKIKAECVNPSTGTNECFSDEIAVHKSWFQTPTTCNFGLWTSGVTRIGGLGWSTGEGDFWFRGWNTVSGVTSYVSCDVRLKNACSGP